MQGSHCFLAECMVEAGANLGSYKQSMLAEENSAAELKEPSGGNFYQLWEWGMDPWTLWLYVKLISRKTW